MSDRETGLEIAVIGMAGRFPGAYNIDEFWENLKNGVESIAFSTPGELANAEIGDELLTNPNYVRSKGGVIEGKEWFDAAFFGYTPTEAEIMDPQVRLFHECSWHALESAGYNPESYDGIIGVYAGAGNNLNWQALSVLSGKSDELGLMSSYLLFEKDYISTRISYKLKLKGPSIAVQTACSTSLVAIHMASRALLMNECFMALAGGVSVSSQTNTGYLYQEGMILSPDGHCRPFDIQAGGTVPGYGVGVVVLKRLKHAVTDRDNILAVIKGSAVNNEGGQNVGYTAPSINSQADIIRTTLHIARVGPESITYVEAHGTGTTLGDPIEIEALKKAFNTNEKGFCGIGSVKSNIGHLDAAAGVAGFIKTVLALKNKQIPPTIHFEKPNPRIDFVDSPYYVNTTLKKWENHKYPLRAGVSSFGIGGTNAHVILEEFSGGTGGLASLLAPLPDAHPARKYQLILLSAKTRSALDKMTENLAEYFKENLLNRGNHKNPTNPGPTLADAAYTLQVGRKAFKYRRKLVCSTADDALDQLSAPGSSSRQVQTFYCKEENRPIIFMFPGVGAQYINMGWGLFQTESVFRQEMDRCFEILKPLLDYDIKEILYPGRGEVSSPTAEPPATCHLHLSPDINQPEIAQVVIFIFEYALAKLLMKWGIKPHAMIGYSLGEYAAACLSGVFSLEDAIELIVCRGKLIRELPPGGMLSVPLPAKELRSLLNNRLSIAIDNGPSCIAAGPEAEIDAFEKRMKERRLICMRLPTGQAIHSHMMAPVLESFTEKVRQVKLNKPGIPYISNVTGKWISIRKAADPLYWANHLRATVQFAKGINRLLKEPHSIFIEIGPGGDLSALVERCIRENHHQQVIKLIGNPQQDISDCYYFLNRIGQLWLYGVNIDWPGFYHGERRRRMPLPTYPFEGQRFWIEGDPFKMGAGARDQWKQPRIHKKKDIVDWFYIPLWEQSSPIINTTVEKLDQFNWLVFISESRFVSKLVNRLEQDARNVIKVRAGREFDKVSDCEYVINPGRSNDYQRIFKLLWELNLNPNKIIHFWNTAINNDKDLSFERLEKAQDLGLFCLLNIARTVGRLAITDDIQVSVITNNMLMLNGDESDGVCPEKATALGAVNIIPLEYSNISCRSIDITIPHPATYQEEELITHLLSEFLIDSSHQVIAYRGIHRWLPTLKLFPLGKPAGSRQRLREKGVYLITGGLGGMGFTLAEHLARTVGARLILINRSSFPGREEWEEWLETHREDNRLSHKIRKILELEKLGARFMVVSADIGNLKQMQEVVDRVKERFGHINGVLHTAGIADFYGVIQNRSQEMTENVMIPKVRGTLVLDRILKGEELDFFVLFSSIGNVLYGHKYGQVGYNAANEFLDSFAYYKMLRDKTFTVTINWDDWLEMGMAVDSIHRKHDGDINKINDESARLKGMSPSEGIDVFKYILENSLQRVIVSTMDLGLQLKHMNSFLQDVEAIEFEGLPGKGYSQRSYHKRFLSKEYVAPKNQLEKELANIWQEIFGIEKVGIHDDFFELGGDSLRGIRFVKKYEELLGETVHVIVIFEAPTIAALASYFKEHYPHIVDRIMELQPVKVTGCHGKEIGISAVKIEQLKQKISVPPFLDETESGKNKQAIFILSPSRSGSTLLRVILGGHPKLFAPPELGLLWFNTLDEIESTGDKIKATRQSCLRTIMQIKQCSVENAQRIIREFEDKQITTKQFYHFIQQCIGDKILVDKSPDYAYSLKILERAEGMFENAMYIHLVRHPYGMIRSYQEAKMDLQIGGHFLKELSLSRRELAELEWTISHQNILEFLTQIPGNRQQCVKFEHLVKQPVMVVESICQFLGLDFSPEMLQPYKDKKKRMTDGIHSGGIMIGDFKFHRYKGIEAGRADSWKAKYREDFLRDESWQVAKALGYTPANKRINLLINPIEKKDYYALSSAQKRLYVMQKVDPNSTAYNMPQFFKLKGDPDERKLEDVFRKLIKRHETLRTSFMVSQNQIVQKIHNEVEFGINYDEISEEETREIVDRFVRPFKLNKAPLLRCSLIKITEKRHILLIDIHHIISDAASNSILIKDFTALYQGTKLPGLRIQYKDYSQWQKNEKKGNALIKQEMYWLNRFKGELPVLDIPTDFPRPGIRTFNGNTENFTIGIKETEALYNIANLEGCTLFMVLLAVFNVLLSKLGGQEDIVVGIPAAGREHLDSEQIIGMFVNTLAMRNYPENDKSFPCFLKEVKKNTAEAFANQDYQFEDLVNKIVKERVSNRNPLFDVMFKFIKRNDFEVKIDFLELKPYKYENCTSRFDMTLGVSEQRKKLFCSFDYCKELFKKGMIESFTRCFKEIVSILVNDKDVKLKNIEISHDLIEPKSSISQEDQKDFGF